MKIRGEIYSRCTGKKIPYNLILPSGYEKSERKYPVLYLFHGLFGSHENWTELTSIVEQAASYPLIIVMPEGSDSWYTDSATVAADRYETFFLSELCPAIDAQYRTINERRGRAVAGLSMGGYGAFKFAVKRPDLFAFAASFSGAFDPAERSDDAPGFDWENLRPSIMRAFGAPGSQIRNENDLFKLIESVPDSRMRQLPVFYFDCGTQDGFLPVNRRLHELMMEKGITHQFEEIEGGHDWDYWGGRVAGLLELATRNLCAQK